MGTLIGHVMPGLAFALLGLWHLIHTVKAFHMKGSKSFSSRFWYPFSGSLSKFKHLELILVLSFSIFAIITQVLDFPSLRLAFKLENFEHAAMFIHLAIFATFSLCTEIANLSETLSGVVGVLAASVFGQELFIIRFHSTDHEGLEGHYHWLLQLIVLVSLAAALGSACWPTNFPLALVLSISVVFQGCWFMNMGSMLWLPELVPQGCSVQFSEAGGDGVVTCASHEADMRARALASLQFSWIPAGILILTGCMSNFIQHVQMFLFPSTRSKKSASRLRILVVVLCTIIASTLLNSY